MRICIYSLSPKIGGGVVTKTVLLLRYLLKNGHEVVWVYPNVKGALPSYVQDLRGFDNLKIIEKRSIQSLRVLHACNIFSQVTGDFDIYQVVSGYSVDGIFFNRKSGHYFLWVATTLRSEKNFNFSFFPKKPKQIISFLNYKLGLLLEKVAAKRSYRIFAASSVSRIKIIDEFNLKPDNVQVVYPIIDTDYYSFKPINCRNSDETYVLFMGIFSGRKNLDLLIRSFVIVHARNPEIKLKLVGKVNGLDDHYKNLINSLGLTNCVDIVGEVSNNVPWYQNAICTVLTSHEEGFGMVLAESLSCGTPVISTQSGGVCDIVEDCVNGFLVKNDEVEISDAILKMYNDVGLRDGFSINGRRLVERKFSVDAIGKQILSEYSNYLLHKKK